MRRELIEILKDCEKDGGFNANYSDFFPNTPPHCHYNVTEITDFPSYRTLEQKYNAEFPQKSGVVLMHIGKGRIASEIKRMELEGLLVIDTQEGIRNATAFGIECPNMENDRFTCEAIFLTTKGKSGWHYFWHKAWENPVTSGLSLIAIVVSIFALFT